MKSYYIVFVLGVIILLLLVGVSFISFSLIREQSNTLNNQDEEIVIEPASGCLLYSDDDQLTRRSRLFWFDIPSAQQFEFPDDGEYSITPVLQNESQLMYLSSPYIPNDKVPFPYLDFHKVIIKDLTTGAVKVISDTDVSQRQALTWSDSNHQYAFMGMSETGRELYYVEGKEANLPEDWNIYVGDSKGNELLIDNGFHPVWSSDGNYLYYLTANAVIRYDMASKNKDVVMENSKWQIEKSTGFAISPDQTRMVFTDKKTASFIAYQRPDITTDSWTVVDTFTISDSTKTPFMPVFSPDGNYVAYYATARDLTGNGGVYMFDFRTHKQVELFPVQTILPYGIQLEWSSKCPIEQNE